MSRSTLLVIVALLQWFAAACATQESMPTGSTAAPAESQAGPAAEYGGAATAIQLDKAVHFSSPEDQDVLAGPGRYQVEPTDEAQLRLVPEGEKPPLLIAAATTSFDLDVAAPAALTIPYGEDTHHVVLLLPGGTALDSIGSYSGTRTRGPSVALGSASVKTTLNAKLAGIMSPAYKELPKVAPKFEQRATDFAIQPGARVANYAPCRMAGTGYTGSVIAEYWRTYKTTGGLFVPPPTLARSTEWDRASVILTQAPAATPPTPETGSWKTERTNPRTPWVRELPGDPYYCVFGNATVKPTGMLPLQPGERVQLLVTSIVTGRGYDTYWIEDTYELAAQGPGSLTFPKVVVAAHYGGANIGFVKWMDVSKEAARRLQNGAFVGFTLKTTGKRIACRYKPDLNNFGQGTLSCPAGEPWPLQQ